MYEQNDYKDLKPTPIEQTQLESAIIELQKNNAELNSIAMNFDSIIGKLLPEIKRGVDNEEKQTDEQGLIGDLKRQIQFYEYTRKRLDSYLAVFRTLF